MPLVSAVHSITVMTVMRLVATLVRSMPPELTDQVLAAWNARDYEGVAGIIFEHEDQRTIGIALTSAIFSLSECYTGDLFDSTFLDYISEEVKWNKLCKYFSKLRAQSIFIERNAPKDHKKQLCLLLQENLCKVLCNISQNLRRFDQDSAFWAIVCLCELIDGEPESPAIAVRTTFIAAL